jgi:SPP1 gp7 family putative phage head morphogenesis protein
MDIPVKAIEDAADKLFDVLWACLPNEAAAAMIGAKPALLAETFKKLLPELRGRAFTITGITRADALQRIRDRIAELPQGADWAEIRNDIVAEMSPYMVDPEADIETRGKQQDAAVRKANMLIRHHGFQAYQAANYDLMDRQRDALPYWQYLTVGDDNVRESHRALNGLVLPANSPFWRDHYPPWDWGCRCQVIPIDRETYGMIAGGELEGRAISDTQLKELEQNGRLAIPESGQVVSVLPRQANNAYRWHPSDMRIPVEDLRKSYDPEVFERFTKEMAAVVIPERNISVWDWLTEKKKEVES